MPLILAIEPDRRQAAQLRSIVKSRLDAELVLADSADHALAALGERVPDLILTAALLPPKDEMALDTRLRSLDGNAAHIQTLTIPVLAAPKREERGGVLSALRRRPRKTAPDGCDPAVFADQCAEYLERARTERASIHAHEEPQAPVYPPPVESAHLEPVVERPEVSPLIFEARAETGAWEATPPDPIPLPAPEPAAAPEQEPVVVIAAKAPVPMGLGLPRVWPDIHGFTAGSEPLERDIDSHAFDFPVEQRPVVTNPTVLADREPNEAGNERADRGEAYEINLDELLTELEPSAPALAAIDVKMPEPEEVAVQPPDAPVVEFEPTGGAPLSAAGIEIDPALWTPSRLGISQFWPPPDAGAKATPAVAFVSVAPAPDVETIETIEPATPIEAPVLSAQEAPAPIPAPPQLSSAAQEPPAPPAAEPPHELARPPVPSQSHAAQDRKVRAKPRGKTGKRTSRKSKPVQDEWGFFDPAQVGFATLLSKLDEITAEGDDQSPSDS